MDLQYDEVAEQASRVKLESKTYVDHQIGRLKIDKLESLAKNHIQRYTIDKKIIKDIDNKLTGVSKLLETGQTIFNFYAKYLQEKEVAFSILQPFAVASEIMMYITFVIIADGRHLCEFIENHYDDVDFHNKKSVSYWIALIDNTALKEILKEYRLLRNMAAHTYHPISIHAAQSFIQRTYENIQRLELVINPLKI